ncbi:MAG: sigma-70 family RNA polymerase sigma factor [Bacteroidales bacterium]|nr:sigma-70 family RNA polymerase sigma factor [Bacteroidales bacterium]
MKEVTDEMYIQQILAGNGRAFSALVERHKDMVFNIIIHIVHQSEETEELAQDVFMKVYQALPEFKMEAKFSTWLYRIAYNTAISWTRKSRPELSAIDAKIIDDYSETTDNELEIKETEIADEQQRQKMKNAIASLKEDDQLLLNLFYYNELSIKEISETMGIQENAVKVRLFRLRNKIKNG